MKPGVFVPWTGGAALVGCAVFFDDAWQTYGLLGIMLFAPLLSPGWHVPSWRAASNRLHYARLGLLVLALGLLLWQPHHTDFALITLLTAALPEEWFFRTYLMPATGRGIVANLLTSLLFSLLHGLTQDWQTAIQVFLPSLFYGWIYQRYQDFPLIVLLHAASNILYIVALHRFPAWLA